MVINQHSTAFRCRAPRMVLLRVLWLCTFLSNFGLEFWAVDFEIANFEPRGWCLDSRSARFECAADSYALGTSLLSAKMITLHAIVSARFRPQGTIFLI